MEGKVYFLHQNIWMETNEAGDFDIPMGFYHSAEMC